MQNKYDKYFKEEYGKQKGQRKLSDQIYKSKKYFPLKEDIKEYHNLSDDFGIGIEFYYNIPKEGRYEKYKNLTPEDMSIYFDKHYYYKNSNELREAGYILY
ncbi:MAG TPA: hypothetical protein PKC85_12230 [Bacteroidia bacterium]|nr:hypothetical protein [Bacteroidia bacterium]HMU20596.1 hypothetical protein [Bacteroidia bacterium]